MPCCTEQHRHRHISSIELMCAVCGFFKKTEMIPDVVSVEIPICHDCFCHLEMKGWNTVSDADLRYLKESLNANHD